MMSVPPQPVENIGKVRQSSQARDSTEFRVFTDQLSNSPKHLPWFSPGYEGMENIFYFLNEEYKITLFSKKILFNE